MKGLLKPADALPVKRRGPGGSGKTRLARQVGADLLDDFSGGVFFVDLIMRKAGETGLERFVSRKRIDKLKAKLENKAGVTVFIATLIPPPFPFTPAVMTASALQSPRGELLIAVFFGRLLRFGIEAVLALYFGRQLIAFMNSDVVTYIVYALIGIAVILSTLSLLRWFKRN